MLQTVADNLEMEYLEKDDWGLLQLLKGFHLFRKGSRKRITNLLSREGGLEGLKVNVFDYRYIISTGKSAKRFKQTVFFVQSKALALPEFWMRPEHILHKVGNMIGLEDINFKEHPEFSNQYYLKGVDEELIRYAFQDEVLHYFTIEKNWYLEGIGYFFILYKKDFLMQADQIKTFYSNGMELWRRLLREQ